MAMLVTITFETGLGNDVIDGGSGTDTVKLSGNYSSYQITHNALENKFTISGSNETKTATNVEQFEFNDVSYTGDELKQKINPIDTHTPPSSANNSGAILLSNEGFNINNFNFYSLVSGQQTYKVQNPYSTSFSTSNITGSEFYDSAIRLIGTKDSSIYTDLVIHIYFQPLLDLVFLSIPTIMIFM